MPSISTRTTSPTLSRPSGNGWRTAPTPAGVPVAITSPGSSVNASDRCATCSKQSKIISPVLPSWRSSPLTQVLMREVVRVAELVGGDEPGPERAVGVEGLAHRHGRRAQLPVAHGDVVGDRVAGDHLVRALVAARGGSACRSRRPARPRSRAGSRRAACGRRRPGPTTQVTCLLKNTGNSGASMPDLGDVVGVVEPDGQELARPDRAPAGGPRRADGARRVVAVDDVHRPRRSRGAARASASNRQSFMTSPGSRPAPARGRSRRPSPWRGSPRRPCPSAWSAATCSGSTNCADRVGLELLGGPHPLLRLRPVAEVVDLQLDVVAVRVGVVVGERHAVVQAAAPA